MAKVSTKRIEKYICNFRTMEYAINGFEVFAQPGDLKGYELSTWHNGNHVETRSYESLEDLAQDMKNESGDLRVWKVVPYED